MRYQFESEKIEDCLHCPCVRYSQTAFFCAVKRVRTCFGNTIPADCPLTEIPQLIDSEQITAGIIAQCGAEYREQDSGREQGI